MELDRNLQCAGRISSDRALDLSPPTSQQSIAVARGSAEEAALDLFVRATLPSAGEAEAGRAMTAIVTIRTARQSERFIAAADAERLRLEIAEFGQAKRKVLAAEVVEGIASIEEAEQRYLAALDAKAREIYARIDHQQLATWLRAADELALLDRARPSQIHTAPESRQ